MERKVDCGCYIPREWPHVNQLFPAQLVYIIRGKFGSQISCSNAISIMIRMHWLWLTFVIGPTSGLACSDSYGVLVRGKPRDVLEFSHIP